jgi:hypothetical protein
MGPKPLTQPAPDLMTPDDPAAPTAPAAAADSAATDAPAAEEDENKPKPRVWGEFRRHPIDTMGWSDILKLEWRFKPGTFEFALGATHHFETVTNIFQHSVSRSGSAYKLELVKGYQHGCDIRMVAEGTEGKDKDGKKIITGTLKFLLEESPGNEIVVSESSCELRPEKEQEDREAVVCYEAFHYVMKKINLELEPSTTRMLFGTMFGGREVVPEKDVRQQLLNVPSNVTPPEPGLARTYLTQGTFHSLLWRLGIAVKPGQARAMWNDLEKDPVFYLNNQVLPSGMDPTHQDPSRGRFVTASSAARQLAKILRKGLWPQAVLNLVTDQLKLEFTDQQVFNTLRSTKLNKYGILPYGEVVTLLVNLAGNGLSLPMFRGLIQKLNIDVEEQYVKMAYDLMDVNGDGALGIREFLGGMKMLLTDILPRQIMNATGLTYPQMVATIAWAVVTIIMIFAFIILSFSCFVGGSGGIFSILQSVLGAGAALGAKSNSSKDLTKLKALVMEKAQEVLNIQKKKKQEPAKTGAAPPKEQSKSGSGASTVTADGEVKAYPMQIAYYLGGKPLALSMEEKDKTLLAEQVEDAKKHDGATKVQLQRLAKPHKVFQSIKHKNVDLEARITQWSRAPGPADRKSVEWTISPMPPETSTAMWDNESKQTGMVRIHLDNQDFKVALRRLRTFVVKAKNPMGQATCRLTFSVNSKVWLIHQIHAAWRAQWLKLQKQSPQPDKNVVYISNIPSGDQDATWEELFQWLKARKKSDPSQGMEYFHLDKDLSSGGDDPHMFAFVCFTKPQDAEWFMAEFGGPQARSRPQKYKNCDTKIVDMNVVMKRVWDDGVKTKKLSKSFASGLTDKCVADLDALYSHFALTKAELVMPVVLIMVAQKVDDTFNSKEMEIDFIAKKCFEGGEKSWDFKWLMEIYRQFGQIIKFMKEIETHIHLDAVPDVKELCHEKDIAKTIRQLDAKKNLVKNIMEVDAKLIKKLDTSVKQLFSDPQATLEKIWQERQERKKAEEIAASYLALSGDIDLLAEDLKVTFKREVNNFTDADTVQQVSSSGVYMPAKLKDLQVKVKFHLIGFEQNEAKNYIEGLRGFLPNKDYLKAVKVPALDEAQREIAKMPGIKMKNALKSGIPNQKTMSAFELEELLDRSEKYRVARAIQYYVKKNMTEPEEQAKPLPEQYRDEKLLAAASTTEQLKADLSQLQNPAPARRASAENLDDEEKKAEQGTEGAASTAGGGAASSSAAGAGTGTQLQSEKTFQSEVGVID